MACQGKVAICQGVKVLSPDIFTLAPTRPDPAREVSKPVDLTRPDPPRQLLNDL